MTSYFDPCVGCILLISVLHIYHPPPNHIIWNMVHFKLVLCSVFQQLSVIEPHSCYGMKCKTGSGQEFRKNISETNFPSRYVIPYVHSR